MSKSLDVSSTYTVLIRSTAPFMLVASDANQYGRCNGIDQWQSFFELLHGTKICESAGSLCHSDKMEEDSVTGEVAYVSCKAKLEI